MKAYQIYYREDQKKHIDYEPFHNPVCTPFFENSVIVDKANEMPDQDYFAVLSWQLRDKIRITRDSWRGLPNIANKSRREFTPEFFEQLLYKGKPDAFSLQCHAPHDPISFCERFHKGLTKDYKHIMNQIGYDWKPTTFQNIFYCNFFFAKGEIYKRYVDEMLKPAMDVMNDMPELMRDSGYFKKYNFEWGDHYPMHTFLCERMFSYFAHIHKLKCLHF